MVTPAGAIAALSLSAQVDDHPPQVVEGPHHRGVRLDRRALQFRAEAIRGQFGQKARGLRGKSAGLEVDEVQLFLGAERQLCTHGWNLRVCPVARPPPAPADSRS